MQSILTRPGRDQDHQPQPACRDHDPEIFYPLPRDTATIEQAKAICRGCPVIGACLAYLADHWEPEGVWAATTPEERRPLYRGGPVEQEEETRPEKPTEPPALPPEEIEFAAVLLVRQLDRAPRRRLSTGVLAGGGTADYRAAARQAIPYLVGLKIVRRLPAQTGYDLLHMPRPLTPEVIERVRPSAPPMPEPDDMFPLAA